MHTNKMFCHPKEHFQKVFKCKYSWKNLLWGAKVATECAERFGLGLQQRGGTGHGDLFVMLVTYLSCYMEKQQRKQKKKKMLSD